MWMMILIGVALAAGFVFALRSQINAYRIAQAEEQLKTQLDGYASQRNFLTLDQQCALSAGESERAGKRNGLDHLKLDRDARSERSSSGQWVISHVPPVRAQRADQSGRPAVNAPRWAPRSIKRPGSQTKVVKVVKVVKTGKASKVVKVVNLTATNREGATNRKGATNREGATKRKGVTNKSRVNDVKPRKQSHSQTSLARQ